MPCSVRQGSLTYFRKAQSQGISRIVSPDLPLLSAHGATRTLCLLRNQELIDYALPEVGSGGGVDSLHSMLAAMATHDQLGMGKRCFA